MIAGCSGAEPFELIPRHWLSREQVITARRRSRKRVELVEVVRRLRCPATAALAVLAGPPVAQRPELLTVERGADGKPRRVTECPGGVCTGWLGPRRD